MKWALRILLCVLGAYVLYRIAMLVFLFILFSPSRPTSFVDDLSTDPATYSQIESISHDFLTLHSYGYERNKYVDALPNVRSKPNVADSAGNVPAFRMDDDIFIITYKWVNASSGLAISDDPEFKTKIETIDDAFRIQHIRDNIYQWDLDLD